MTRSVALIFDHPDAAPFTAHSIDTLSGFGVPHLLVGASKDWRESLAECERQGAVVHIVYNVGKQSLAAELSALTDRPVLAVPIEGGDTSALQALQQTTTPGQAPVGSLAIGKAGAINAALFAVAILANADPQLAGKLQDFRSHQTQSVLNDSLATGN